LTGTDLEAREQQIAALQAKQEEEFAGDSFTTPILKLCQPLTKEVQEDEAEAGEFLNTATGETLGDEVKFIIARDKKTGEYYIAFGDTIPASWEPLVGDEWIGTLFTEYPDAEEQYRERVNRKEIEWEKGPLVSTTYNYTGYVIVPGIEDDDPDELQPVRLSLQRSNKKAADKINTIRRSVLRGKALWDIVFDFSTARKTFPGGTSYVLNAKAGRKTTDEEKYAAAELAIALDAGRVSTTGEPDTGAPAAAEAPPAEGGLAV
jgi:hypothetical protein